MSILPTTIARAERITISLVYCIAFDAANIEYTTAFYKKLAENYKKANAEKLQPESTRRAAGQERIFREVNALGIENGEATATAIYRIAVDVLISNTAH